MSLTERFAENLRRITQKIYPFNNTSPEYAGFENVVKDWKPAKAHHSIIVNWLMTEWCNYKCPDCLQNHDRKKSVERNGKTYSPHAFDNFPAEKWVNSFKNLSKRYCLSLIIGGGEIFLDKENIMYFLSELVEMPGINDIRLDTNASWNPKLYKGIRKEKITLMCSFHPSMSSIENFVPPIDSLLNKGFRVELINYVMTLGQMRSYEEVRKVFARLNIPVNPQPFGMSGDERTEEELGLLRKFISEQDL